MPRRGGNNTHRRTHTHLKKNHRTLSPLCKRFYAHVLDKSWGTAFPLKNTNTHTLFIYLILLIWTRKNGRKRVSSSAIVSCNAGERMQRWKADAKQFNEKSDLNAPFIKPTMASPTIGLRFAPWRCLFLMPQKEKEERTKKRKRKRNAKLTRFELWAMSMMIFSPFL